MARRYALRDDQWNRIKDLLPGRAGTVGVTDARALPLGVFPIRLGQGRERFPLDLIERLATADPKFTHRPVFHRFHGERDGGVILRARRTPASDHECRLAPMNLIALLTETISKAQPRD